MKLNISMFRSPGTRMTSQRTLVFDIISRGGGHLGADEIYARARRKNPRISLSTVYRAIARFKELGLVVESHLGQEHHHYEAGHNSSHFHLVCLGCGAVIEFEYPLVDRVHDEVAMAGGFKIINAEMNLIGYCRQCQG